MALFAPTVYKNRITDITAEELDAWGVRGVLLDVDNTLTTHDNPLPSPGIPEWIDMMKAAGIGMVIISNNNKERVEPFAAKLGLPFTSMSCKPLPFKYIKGMKMLGGNRKNTAMVGDQIFTDVMGANLSGMKCLMVLAILAEESAGFKFKRRIEKGFIEKYLNQQGGPL